METLLRNEIVSTTLALGFYSSRYLISFSLIAIHSDIFIGLTSEFFSGLTGIKCDCTFCLFDFMPARHFAHLSKFFWILFPSKVFSTIV
jgi:hypothetical protein